MNAKVLMLLLERSGSTEEREGGSRGVKQGWGDVKTNRKQMRRNEKQNQTLEWEED